MRICVKVCWQFCLWRKEKESKQMFYLVEQKSALLTYAELNKVNIIKNIKR